MLVRTNLPQPFRRLHGLCLRGGQRDALTLEDAHHPQVGLQLSAAYHKGVVIVATLWSTRLALPSNDPFPQEITLYLVRSQSERLGS